MNKYLRGVLSTAAAFAILLGTNYVAAMIRNTSFEPHWIETAGLAILVGILTVFGPDTAQRKKNRERLLDSFKK